MGRPTTPLSSTETSGTVAPTRRSWAVLGAMLEHLQPTTRLAVSCGLGSPTGWSRSDTIAGWRNQVSELVNDIPAVFALQAG
jgi:16S rRNA (cytidine1402-2'-O)-methyltransferase